MINMKSLGKVAKAAFDKKMQDSSSGSRSRSGSVASTTKMDDDKKREMVKKLLASGVVRMKKGGSAKWIQEAVKKPGALRKSLGVKKGEKIPAGKLAAAAKKPGKLGQRARLAQTLKGLKK